MSVTGINLNKFISIILIYIWPKAQVKTAKPPQRQPLPMSANIRRCCSLLPDSNLYILSTLRIRTRQDQHARRLFHRKDILDMSSIVPVSERPSRHFIEAFWTILEGIALLLKGTYILGTAIILSAGLLFAIVHNSLFTPAFFFYHRVR